MATRHYRAAAEEASRVFIILGLAMLVLDLLITLPSLLPVLPAAVAAWAGMLPYPLSAFALPWWLAGLIFVGLASAGLFFLWAGLQAAREVRRLRRQQPATTSHQAAPPARDTRQAPPNAPALSTTSEQHIAEPGLNGYREDNGSNGQRERHQETTAERLYAHD
jgi:hypothetical protein